MRQCTGNGPRSPQYLPETSLILLACRLVSDKATEKKNWKKSCSAALEQCYETLTVEIPQCSRAIISQHPRQNEADEEQDAIDVFRCSPRRRHGAARAQAGANRCRCKCSTAPETHELDSSDSFFSGIITSTPDGCMSRRRGGGTRRNVEREGMNRVALCQEHDVQS